MLERLMGVPAMLVSDWNLTNRVAAAWRGGSSADLCPLLADQDKFLRHCADVDLRPGISIWICPECGTEHRWAMLKTLLMDASIPPEKVPPRLAPCVFGTFATLAALYGGEAEARDLLQARGDFHRGLDK
jgi:hypothetical protein